MKRAIHLLAVAILAAACVTALAPQESGALSGAPPAAAVGTIAEPFETLRCDPGRATAIVGATRTSPADLLREAALHRKTAPVGRGLGTRPTLVVPPPVVVTATPTWSLIPGTAAYFSPEIEADVYLHGGVWYYRVDGVWFMGPSHTGPWKVTPGASVPETLTRIPPAWRPEARPPAGPPEPRNRTRT